MGNNPKSHLQEDQRGKSGHEAYNKIPNGNEKGQMAPKITWVNVTNLTPSTKSKTQENRYFMMLFI